MQNADHVTFLSLEETLLKRIFALARVVSTPSHFLGPQKHGVPFVVIVILIVPIMYSDRLQTFTFISDLLQSLKQNPIIK